MKTRLEVQQRIANEAAAEREKLTLRIKELEDKVCKLFIVRVMVYNASTLGVDTYCKAVLMCFVTWFLHMEDYYFGLACLLYSFLIGLTITSLAQSVCPGFAE